MPITIKEINQDALPLFASIPIRFEVHSILQLELVDGGLGGIRLQETAVREPYWKDYDEFGEGPQSWPAQFDIRNWGLLLANQDGRAVGGAAIAWNTNGVNMLEGRDDLAVLWDIRVRPEYRGQGVGSQLFQASAAWARQHGCKMFKIETQNINVPACRFYARQGCKLGCIHRYGYTHPRYRHEAMLLWYLDL